MEQEIKEGQVWRKEGPHGWYRIDHICDPNYPDAEYDGGLPGVFVTEFPPQLHGIQCRGKRKGWFIANSKKNTWEEQLKRNRFLLRDGWKRGDPIYPFEKPED